MPSFPRRIFPRRATPVAAALAALLVAFLAAAPAGAAPRPDRALEARAESARSAMAARVPPEWRTALAGQEDFDVLDYHLALRVDPTAQTIAGTVTVDARSLVAALTLVDLDLWEGMEVTAVTGPSGALAYRRGRHDVAVTLDRAYAPGEEFLFTVAYDGAPMQAGFGSFVFETHGSGAATAPAIGTLSEPYYARTWWPCKDEPSDKATATVEVTVPDTLVAASQGTLQSVIANGDGTRTYLWRENYPVATYLISLAISNYLTDTRSYTSPAGATFPLTDYYYPEDSLAAATDWSVLPAMMDHEVTLHGEYPFAAEKYGMAEFPLFTAMEHQTMTSFPAFAVTGRHTWDDIIVHELSHQWFGDRVTPADWREIWLNEGFARYSEAMWEEHLGGAESLRVFMDDLLPGNGDYLGTVYDPSDLFGSTVYDKGAWVVHMLRFALGDSAFFGSLRDYLSAHAYGNVTSADLEAACEARAGTDLSWFFNAWLTQRYRPHYRLWWLSTPDSAGYELRLHLDQTQQGTGLFPMPLAARATTASGDTTLTFFNNAWSQEFSWQLAGNVTAFTLDPDDHVLKFVEVVAAPGATTVNGSEAGGAFLSLARPAPNPSRGETELRLDMAREAEGELAIFDLQGRRVVTLARGTFAPGTRTFRWDGHDEGGAAVAPGLYICEARAGGARESRFIVRLP